MQEKINQHILPDEAKMILIGGGIYHRSARPLLEMGLNLSGKSKPNVLIVPTPKNRQADFEKLIAGSNKMYGEDLGVNVDFLHNYNNMPENEAMQNKFDQSDVIYVSGGDTRYAMELWKKHGVDTMLSDAMRKGKIITGISAGALAWFNKGHSDSQSYEVPKGEPWNHSIVNGMGIIDTIVAPHYDSLETPDGRLRSEHFKDYLESQKKDGLIEYGLGMDNNAAIVALNGLIRIVTSKNEAGLYVVGSDRSEKKLDAPKYNSDIPLEQLDEDGISWQEFYDQLSNKTE